jgi:predicted AAA+ superfamily ATPase
VRATDATGLPLGATADDRKFKIIFLDVGLVCASLGLSAIDLHKDLVLVNSGAIAEQVVGQLLRVAGPKFKEPELYYWMREDRGSEAEVDYIVQQQSRVLPIEVKAGTSGSLKSLHYLMAQRQLKQAVRFNADTPSITNIDAQIGDRKRSQYELISLPLYWAEELPRLLTQ